jgi:aldose 1-epimerase
MSGSRAGEETRREDRFEEARLANGRLELTFVPGFGCHWTRLRISAKGEWLDLIVPVPDHETLRSRPTGHGSYLLAPWSNRIAGAAFELDGERHELTPNFPDGTAIHGDARTRPWNVLASGPSRFEASLDARDFSDFNFPFALAFRHSLELSADRLRVELSIENVDRRRAPVGFGFHPFLRRRLTGRDRDVILLAPLDLVYPATDCLPVGPAIPVSGRTDLRGLRRLGSPGLDDCFTGLADTDFRMIYPESGVEVRFRVDPVFTHAVIYAPNDERGAPRDFFCVEPVSCANDGFNLLARGARDTGVKLLDPGERWGGGWELSVGDL